jgi:copper transport protein
VGAQPRREQSDAPSPGILNGARIVRNLLRLTGALLLTLLLTLLGAAVLAAPASAHARLETTEPAARAALDAPPDQVLVRFNEPVEATLGAVRVFDADGRRLDTGPVTRPGGDARAVAVDLPEDLGAGAFVVTYRVVSADAHPIQGAFTFRVGAAPPGDEAALARRLLAETGAAPSVDAVLAIGRWTSFAGLILLVGGAAFLRALWPAGVADPRARRVVWTGLGLATGGTVLGLLAQGPYAAALGLADLVDADVLTGTFGTRFGRVWLVRLALLALAAVGLRRWFRADRLTSRAWTAAAATLGTALLMTPGLSGHAAAGGLVPLALGLDVVHLAAASFWVGGLVLLLVAALRGSVPPAGLASRFSRVALVCVVVVLVTGSLQGWREVRDPGALLTTTYGGLLVAKVGAFAAVVAAAYLSRRWVQGRMARAGDVRALRRAVGVEVGVVAVLLVITTLLVAAPPARVAYAEPFTETVRTERLWLDLVVDPPQAGTTDVHVYTYDPGGALVDVQGVTLALTLPSRDVGPIEVPVERVDGSHYASYGFELPLPGTWELAVEARITDKDQVRATTEVIVR